MMRTGRLSAGLPERRQHPDRLRLEQRRRDGQFELGRRRDEPHGVRFQLSWRRICVNNSGQIAGYGTYDGVMNAFLLTPTPEPSTLLLTGAGLMGLLAYAWRKRRQRRPSAFR